MTNRSLDDRTPRCPRCGYDLSARRTGDPCSECGLELPRGSVVVPCHAGSGPAAWIGVVQGFLAAMQLVVLPERLAAGEYGFAAVNAGVAVVFGWLFLTWWRDRRAARAGGGVAALLVFPEGLAVFQAGRERWRLSADGIESIELSAVPYEATMLIARPRVVPGLGALTRLSQRIVRRGHGAAMLAFRWEDEARTEAARMIAERLPRVPVRPLPTPPAEAGASLETRI